MATLGQVVMRALMMLMTLLIVVGAFLAAKTPFQHVAVALMIFLYCAIRFVGLTVIERSELAMINAQRPAAALEELQADHRKSRLRAAVECGFLTILAFYAALKITMPSLLVGWP